MIAMYGCILVAEMSTDYAKELRVQGEHQGNCNPWEGQQPS